MRKTNIKERGYIYENDVLYSIDGNISDWEKNYIKDIYNIEVVKQAKLKGLNFNLKAGYFTKLMNKDINFNQLENKALKITWDIYKSILNINEKSFKVDSDTEYVHKILKTKIKAYNGIKGLVKFIIQSSDIDSVFNNSCYLTLLKIYNTVKAS